MKKKQIVFLMNIGTYSKFKTLQAYFSQRYGSFLKNEEMGKVIIDEYFSSIFDDEKNKESLFVTSQNVEEEKEVVKNEENQPQENEIRKFLEKNFEHSEEEFLTPTQVSEIVKKHFRGEVSASLLAKILKEIGIQKKSKRVNKTPAKVYMMKKI